MVWEQDRRIPYFCFAYIMKEKLVIVPTYNEAENIEELVADVMALDYPFDMLVVDDDSPDGTAQLVEALQPKYKDRLHLLKRPTKEGLGPAYLEAFQWALDRNYQYLFEMDADFSHDPYDLINYMIYCSRTRQMLLWDRDMFVEFKSSIGLCLEFYCPILPHYTFV